MSLSIVVLGPVLKPLRSVYDSRRLFRQYSRMGIGGACWVEYGDTKTVVITSIGGRLAQNEKLRVLLESDESDATASAYPMRAPL
jgi:hypothetical protein